MRLYFSLCVVGHNGALKNGQTDALIFIAYLNRGHRVIQMSDFFLTL